MTSEAKRALLINCIGSYNRRRQKGRRLRAGVSSAYLKGSDLTTGLYLLTADNWIRLGANQLRITR